MSDYQIEPFAEVMMLGRWPVILPAYRVEHCRVQPNWEEGRLLSMHAHLNPGDVLYDVGAEHGDLSALYATWVRESEEFEISTAGVVLVEGSDRFWPVIRATFEANGLVPVGCYAGFASDVDSPESERGPGWCEYPLTGPGTWPEWAEPAPVAHHGFKSLVESKQTIPNMRFDTMAEALGPPDAMTIDVEGAELRVLHGSQLLLRQARPLVWVSIHPTLIAHDYPESGILGTGDPDHERQRILDFMWECNYEGQHLETNHEEHWVFWPIEREDFDPWLDVPHLRDVPHPEPMVTA